MQDSVWRERISTRLKAMYYVTNQADLKPDAITEAYTRLVLTRVPFLAEELKGVVTSEPGAIDTKRLKNFRAELSSLLHPTLSTDAQRSLKRAAPLHYPSACGEGTRRSYYHRARLTWRGRYAATDLRTSGQSAGYPTPGRC